MEYWGQTHSRLHSRITLRIQLLATLLPNVHREDGNLCVLHEAAAKTNFCPNYHYILGDACFWKERKFQYDNNSNPEEDFRNYAKF